MFRHKPQGSPMISMKNPVFTVGETHGRALRYGNRLIANSQDVGWGSMHAAIIEEGPFLATEPAIGHPMLIYHLTRPTEVSRKIEGGPGNRQLIGPRRICLTPGDATTRWEHHGHPEILQVYLRGSIYQAAASENLQLRHVSRGARAAFRDSRSDARAACDRDYDGVARWNGRGRLIHRYSRPNDGCPFGPCAFIAIAARA